MSVVIPAKLAKRAEEILNSGSDRQLLKLYRDETTLVVLMVRVRNEERRDKWKKEQEELKVDLLNLEMETGK